MAAPPRVCVPIISESQIISTAEPLADLFEVRIDLIGRGWRNVVPQLKKPWIACNRRVEEGGSWQDSEGKRIDELMRAVGLGAHYIDIELGTTVLDNVIKELKGKTQIIVSYHNLVNTPPIERMRQVVLNELAAGADICKVVTSACDIRDNAAMLELIRYFPGKNIISFCMGALGQVSRILSPVVGGFLTWASSEEGSESAQGQVAVSDLRRFYRLLGGE